MGRRNTKNTQGKLLLPLLLLSLPLLLLLFTQLRLLQVLLLEYPNSMQYQIEVFLIGYDIAI